MRIEFEIPEDILHRLLDPVPLPLMARVHHAIVTPAPIVDVAVLVRRQVAAYGAAIRPGARIAVGVGSRGVDKLPEIVKALVDGLRSLGAEPFIVPAMGSHGGATAEGQTQILAHLGVTEAAVGAPIVSDMTTVVVGTAPDGTSVRLDKHAVGADGIVFVARVKPHTAFHSTYESGLAKMIAIGLGKQEGAAACHARGFGEMGRMVPALAAVAMAKAPILFGVAVVENAFDKAFHIEVVAAARILSDEPALLETARGAMPRIPFDDIDVLIVDEIGKNISGDGADPNITGRYPTPFASGKPDVNKMVVLDLTAASSGNANGVGMFDYTTVRLARKMDLGQTYPNPLTSTVPGPVALPMILPNDRLALAAALLTCYVVGREPRVVRLTNTLTLGAFMVSPGLLGDVAEQPALGVVSPAAVLPFDADGDLTDLGVGHAPAETSVLQPGIA